MVSRLYCFISLSLLSSLLSLSLSLSLSLCLSLSHSISLSLSLSVTVFLSLCLSLSFFLMPAEYQQSVGSHEGNARRQGLNPTEHRSSERLRRSSRRRPNMHFLHSKNLPKFLHEGEKYSSKWMSGSPNSRQTFQQEKSTRKDRTSLKTKSLQRCRICSFSNLEIWLTFRCGCACTWRALRGRHVRHVRQKTDERIEILCKVCPPTTTSLLGEQRIGMGRFTCNWPRSGTFRPFH